MDDLRNKTNVKQGGIFIEGKFERIFVLITSDDTKIVVGGGLILRTL